MPRIARRVLTITPVALVALIAALMAPTVHLLIGVLALGVAAVLGIAYVLDELDRHEAQDAEVLAVLTKARQEMEEYRTAA